MPTTHNVLDCATHVSWFGDVDSGEMFLNYPVYIGIRPFEGMDVTWIEIREETKGEGG